MLHVLLELEVFAFVGQDRLMNQALQVNVLSRYIFHSLLCSMVSSFMLKKAMTCRICLSTMLADQGGCGSSSFMSIFGKQQRHLTYDVTFVVLFE